MIRISLIISHFSPHLSERRDRVRNEESNLQFTILEMRVTTGSIFLLLITLHCSRAGMFHIPIYNDEEIVVPEQEVKKDLFSTEIDRMLREIQDDWNENEREFRRRVKEGGLFKEAIDDYVLPDE
ncbi:hypothetical protein PENTCL1PPCAC_24455 [Pristionchus entomophagus]|uniref:Uncharacterized protein n=1 Tax=Pristionchus entomophagus TaxID=358040 RepID=A0AAV5U5Y5_9BILA|nr:hypothetical protein PENTCL1PPCAC_24455 [Pristionchus entomophagus]